MYMVTILALYASHINGRAVPLLHKVRINWLASKQEFTISGDGSGSGIGSPADKAFELRTLESVLHTAFSGLDLCIRTSTFL